MRKITFLQSIILLAGLLVSSLLNAKTDNPELRIATPWPAQNTIIMMLGYGEQIVGTSVIAKRIPLFRQMLPNIDNVPVISISNQLNPEQIISLRTQLLFVAKGMEVPQRDILESAGVKVVEYPANSLQALQARVQATAKELGPDAQNKALEYQRYFDRNVRLVNERLVGLTDTEKRRVYHSMGNTLFTSGRPSLNQDWMDLAGAKNVAETWFSDKKNNSGEVLLETIIAANPDVIVAMNKEDANIIRTSSQWKAISAVKNQQVYVNPKGMFWWCRETSEEALQFLWLAQTLYPERFADIDMKQETADFYLKFFGISLSDAQIDNILHP
ncbi:MULTISPECIES: ABC transporter substrate-binding protein [Providencia]|uniref:ABC transporter substrate-binding protein n=1 Tax=Providencia huaxiensis TaxID=2027290 RepID=A0ABU2IZT1_9GAMM|nr:MULTISPECIES: ABC transporter substrate-binding protein [Providencia]MBZ3681159.1 ABC transporter substrate-binding protein [Providencia rettgeri]AXH62289.1 ABC transporter substrate-binding protein [Providencia huaxiensis]MDT0134565.1 ABC transporter substrate-binding protein [Providencia huaxiensis]MDT1980970.1 ABC transporter substrate-binding protein [Providencia huaxiensis]QLR00298.1 ABC transporter substrate-binding protein [Providencia rettgeri]